MENGTRRALLAILTSAAIACCTTAIAVMVATADGLGVEEVVILGLGLGLLSFVCVQVLGASLWSAFPPALLRLLGYIPPADDRKGDRHGL